MFRKTEGDKLIHEVKMNDSSTAVLSPKVVRRYLTIEQAAAYIGVTKESFEYLLTKSFMNRA